MTAKAGAPVRLKGVAKRYGHVEAVKPLDLDIEGGTLVTLLGPSGCGKTTLLRMVAGLEQVSAGRIEIGGQDVTAMSAGERNVSMVFQSYALFPHMSVLDNVAYGLVSSQWPKAKAHAKAEAMLEMVGLGSYGQRLPFEMSGGQQQRVALARALVLEPDVLLFDEPLSNLDARLRRAMREEIRALQQRLGLTAIYVTHDQAEAMAVSDKIVIMHNAGIAQTGSPSALYSQPDSVFVATFMGEANAVKGQILSLSGAEAQVQLGALTMTLPHRSLPLGPVDLIIRPESIRLNASGVAGLPARITSAIYMGAQMEYVLDTAVGTIFGTSPQIQHRFMQGQEVQLSFDPAGVILVRP